MALTASEVAALKSLLDCWSAVEYVSTAIVLFGVIGEFVAEFTVFARNRKRARRLGKCSTLILIVGLIGELISLGRVSVLSGQLVAFLEGQAESERGKRVNLETLVAPRRLDAEQQRQMGDAVRKFVGQSVTVLSYGLDMEGAVLGAQIIAALRYGGLSVVDNRAHRIQSGGFDFGIHVRGPAGEFVSSLATVLKEIGKLETVVNIPTSPGVGAALEGRAEMQGGASLGGGGGTVPVPVPTTGPVTIMVGVKPAQVLPVE